MELSAVPKAMMPRAVTATSGSRKRNDDNSEMSQQGASKDKLDVNLSNRAADVRDAERNSRANGIARMNQLARRLKIEHDPQTEERSLPHQQETRARIMREKLTSAYTNDSGYVQKAGANNQHDQPETVQRVQVSNEKAQTGRASHSQPIHLVA